MLDYENPILDILYAEEREPDWLIPNMLLQGTLVCLAGEPAAGKSYLSYTLALSIASGCSALSGVVPEGKPRTVLYFDQENGEQDRNKYLTCAWWGLADSKGVPPDALLLDKHFFPVAFRLNGPDWYEQAAAFIERYQPVASFIDTSASSFDMASENDNAEAAKVIGKLRRLQTLTDHRMSVIIVRHAKQHEQIAGVKRKMRGATMWQSLADQVIFQIKSGRERPDGLSLTRMINGKSRAYGMKRPIYISPSYTDDKQTGLLLEGSYEPSREHRAQLVKEGED